MVPSSVDCRFPFGRGLVHHLRFPNDTFAGVDHGMDKKSPRNKSGTDDQNWIRARLEHRSEPRPARTRNQADIAGCSITAAGSAAGKHHEAPEGEHNKSPCARE